MATCFTEDGLELADGSVLPIYAGEFHYWRTPPKSWRAALLAIKELGLNIVSTKVPWSVHETSLGQFDFSGPLDLGAFLDEVHDLGMHALLGPGPHCSAQLTHFGLPERVLANEDIQARGSRGAPLWIPAPPKMFPMPSYASKHFQKEVGAWFAKVGEIVAPRAHPKGPVLALQVDHQLPMFWRSAAFEGDYHPDALAWWDEFSGGQTAPRRYQEEEMEHALTWLHFKEEYLRRSLRWLGESLDEVGLGELARYHNLPACPPKDANQPLAEESVGGVAGMDFSEQETSYAGVRERAAYLAGTSTLPFATQLSIGGPPWLPARSEVADENVALGALAGGIRAFNICMAVGRERWYGGLLNEQLQTTESADWVQPLLAALGDLNFHTLRRVTPIALVVSRAEARAALASCAIHSATPTVTSLLGLGPEGHASLAMDEDARLYPRWFAAISAALDLAELPYQLVDESALHTLDWRTKAIVMPTLRRVDGAAWAALHSLSSAGMQVVIGPKVPSEDERGRPLGGDALKPPGAGLIAAEMLDDIDVLASSLLDLAGELSDLWIAPESSGVHCSVYSESEGEAKVLFVGNSTNAAQEVLVNVPAGSCLSDVISGQEIRDEAGVAAVALQGYQVRMFALLS